jgi:predicted O-methyltransferase YrrM
MITWIDERSFEVGGQRFLLESGANLPTRRSDDDDLFVLGKSRHMVERFVERNAARNDVRHVLEMGILHGGSVVLEHEVCRPAKLVAIDLDPRPVDRLEQYIADHSLEDRIRLHYGVDQSDEAALGPLVDAEFSGAELDLVIDDASHLYEPSRRSFELLFPRVREGGLYVIEDWDWAHYPGDAWQEGGGPYAEHPALTNLIVEILMLAGTRPDVVSEVTIARSLAEVVRGPAALDSPMCLEDLYVNRGLPFRPLL